jgi:hypothetical protein
MCNLPVGVLIVEFTSKGCPWLFVAVDVPTEVDQGAFQSWLRLAVCLLQTSDSVLGVSRLFRGANRWALGRWSGWDGVGVLRWLIMVRSGLGGRVWRTLMSGCVGSSG